MQCPQCGVETPDDAWNCVSCRVNLYWAHQHFGELARIRGQQGLEARPPTPSFLVSSHKKEMTERAPRYAQIESKVRTIARRIMRGEATGQP